MTDGLILIECSCGRRSWMHSAEAGGLSPSAIASRMRCTACGAANVHARWADQPAMLPAERENLKWKIELYLSPDGRPLEVLARCSGATLALVAYAEGMRTWPHHHLKLSEGARIVRNSDEDRRNGYVPLSVIEGRKGRT